MKLFRLLFNACQKGRVIRGERLNYRRKNCWVFGSAKTRLVYFHSVLHQFISNCGCFCQTVRGHLTNFRKFLSHKFLSNIIERIS